jgi:hypothetical protein
MNAQMARRLQRLARARLTFRALDPEFTRQGKQDLRSTRRGDREAWKEFSSEPQRRHEAAHATDFALSRIGERVGTRRAEDAKSYDRATELEMAGATVLDLKPTEWRDLALAA